MAVNPPARKAIAMSNVGFVILHISQDPCYLKAISGYYSQSIDGKKGDDE